MLLIKFSRVKLPQPEIRSRYIFPCLVSSPASDNPGILILFDAETRNITCREHVPLLHMFGNIIQFMIWLKPLLTLIGLSSICKSYKT